MARRRPSRFLCRVGCHRAAFLPEEVLGPFAVTVLVLARYAVSDLGRLTAWLLFLAGEVARRYPSGSS